MDTMLAKLLITCLVCELVGLTTGVPLKDGYYRDRSTRNKRSPANNFSLFGKPVSFVVPNPITTAQQTFNSLGNFFKPAIAPQNRNNERPIGTQSINNKTPINESPANSPPLQDGNIDKSTVLPPPENLVVPKAAVETVNKYDRTIANEKEKTATYPQTTTSKSTNDINKNDNNYMNIDKSVLDAIFNDVNDSTTTEDVTMDYTTETGDYESTTTDDLLRVAAPIVASLLG